MKREECIALLKRYAEYNGMGIPNLAGCREAMSMAADLLSQPSLPSNIDEAAGEYAIEVVPDRFVPDEGIGYKAAYTLLDINAAFKAGAEWMAAVEAKIIATSSAVV